MTFSNSIVVIFINKGNVLPSDAMKTVQTIKKGSVVFEKSPNAKKNNANSVESVQTLFLFC